MVFKSADARAMAGKLSSDGSSRITESIGLHIAQREALKVLLAGTISASPSGYRIDLRALQPATGELIAVFAQEAAEKEQVLSAVAALAARVRQALGESATEVSETEAAEIVSAVSLEAMRAYAHAQELTMAHKIREALHEYERAVAIEPAFGRAYAGMAVIYSNYFKEMDKAESSYKESFKYLERMTEREKYRTLGTYYLNVARNYRKAIENYETLARLYPADDGAHGNLALASVLIGDIPRAQAEVRRSLELYPRNSLQRYNYAMYSMYAADFATAIVEAKRLHDENPTFEYAFLPLAVSQLAMGEIAASWESYDRMSAQSRFGASFAILGRADSHLYFGRRDAAIALLVEGIEADANQKNDAHETAQKYVVLAEAWLGNSDRERAADAAIKAVALNRHESTLFPAARVLLQADRGEEAVHIAADLKKMLQRHTTAYARLIMGELAGQQGTFADAIDAFQEAQSRQDSWFGRFLLGRTYVEAGHAAEGLAELEVCAARSGETTDAFFFDMPTLRYLPPLYYWLGRAQQDVGVAAQARASYDRFLQLRGAGDADLLVSDARARRQALAKG
jgi:tetratricopeptide (TPR) repeat protein